MSLLEEAIISWFEVNKRDLPWRSSTPWGVMVSEFMLQQTPVARVLPKWHEWMVRWPTPADLASATPAEIITAWGRLGYPRRALRLYESAKVIANDYNNEVPRSQEHLLALAGVGEYTAAAIASFAYQEENLVLDVNIRRLFARLFDGQEIESAHLSKVERTLRRALIPENRGHIWAAATMELGALICTARTPKCDVCPVSSQCAWRAQGYPKSDLVKRVQEWHGTDRQIRGKIVQALRESASLTQAQIELLWNDEQQVEKALKTLANDGLITREGDFYLLPTT